MHRNKVTVLFDHAQTRFSVPHWANIGTQHERQDRSCGPCLCAGEYEGQLFRKYIGRHSHGEQWSPKGSDRPSRKLHAIELASVPGQDRRHIRRGPRTSSVIESKCAERRAVRCKQRHDQLGDSQHFAGQISKVTDPPATLSHVDKAVALLTQSIAAGFRDEHGAPITIPGPLIQEHETLFLATPDHG